MIYKLQSLFAGTSLHWVPRDSDHDEPNSDNNEP